MIHDNGPGEDLCQYALKSVHSFSKYSVHKLVTDGRMNKGREQMPPASLDWRMDRNYMFTDGIFAPL